MTPQETLSAYMSTAFPKSAKLRDGTMIVLRPLTPDDRDEACKFFERVPEDDRAFLKEDVINRREVEAWLDRIDPATETVIVAAAAGTIVGTAVLRREAQGWARHVGEIRVVADPATRRQGLGHVLAETVFAIAVRIGLEKMIAQMMANQTGAIRVFDLLGFSAEATLRNHVRDRNGHKHDLLIMANEIEQSREATTVDSETAFIPRPR
ncbi:MAG TPA: GNAT family N-acetyltransferase [Candidatus Binataceae bacterium]|nr:GNAT family N-acetyltransferase [Candidatus Binataceae bacterium]